MKKRIPILLLLAGIAITCGYLFHKISWIGRMGINLAYHEYEIFKSWWKSSLLVFGIYLVLYLIHYFISKDKGRGRMMVINTVSMLIALAGLYYTYYDFRTDFSHRIAGERFHLGFYLFWLGWIVINLHFIISKPKEMVKP
jgi:TRAP-type uncharacterized transport system fused permease subunit